MTTTQSRNPSDSVTRPRELEVSVKSQRNVFQIEVEDICITFETSGAVLPRATEFHTFAAWAVLPLGMAQKRNIFIRGIGDRETERNAARLAQIWANWIPQKFGAVSLRFEAHCDSIPAATDQDLVFYSGGVDSTYNLLQRFGEKKRHTLLTIHGLDYKEQDQARFRELLEKTGPLVKHVGGERVFARTNIYKEYKKLRVYPDLGHGFALAAAAFLWDGVFSKVEIAADFALHEQFLAHPWGTNSATNQCFRSGTLRLVTAQDDITRAEKISAIAKNREALNALTFCVDYSARPHNCGVCSKCIRTKAMFLASIGYAPDIFVDRSWCPEYFKVLKLKNRNQLAHFLALYAEARKNGTEQFLPGLIETYNSWAELPWIKRAIKNVKQFVRGR